MKNKNFAESLKNMFDGFIYILKCERNLKIHFAIAIFVFALSLFFNLSPIKFCVVTFAIFFVICAELFNTAIEQTVDLCCGKKIHPVAKIAKDVASLSVFFAAVCALIIGCIIFLPYFF